MPIAERIALLSDNLPLFGGVGGVGSYTAALAAELAAKGLEVHVFVPEANSRTVREQDGVVVWPCPVWERRRQMPVRDAAGLTLRRRSAGSARRALALASVMRHVAGERPFRVLESPEFDALGEFVDAKGYQLLSVGLHGPATMVLAQNPAPVRKSPERSLALRADVLHAGSNHARQQIGRHWGVDLPQCRVIPHPVVRAEEPQRKGVVRGSIVCFGRIHELKGCVVLVEALALLVEEFPTLRATFIGNPVQDPEGGPDSVARLRRLASKLGVAERVEVLTPLHGSALREEVRRHEVCVLPSLTETAGIAAMEAIAWGVPTVLSDIPAFVELDDDSGLLRLTAAGNATSLAAGIAGRLGHPLASRQAAESAWEMAARWEPPVVAASLLEAWGM